ncbi:MAG: SPOR domain-containing protein [Gammaproteobacteria bacterium]|nr:SPOR domain-containing protein [Gammaproteobacteria bacterium]MDH5513544.1 SPOR domain-containing protein [Gammaproteobacteria bacterium]
MNTHNRIGNSLVAILFMLAMSAVASVAHAQIDVLDAIDVSHADDYSTISINLNVPVHYKSHVPQKSGDVLRIRVDPVLTLGTENDILFGNEFLQWSPDKQVPLSEVTYQSSGPSTATIILQFEESVEFEVPKSPNSRRLVVRVKHPEAHTREKRLQSLSYAINLASSTTPFTDEEIPQVDAMLSYRLYTTEFMKNGKQWTRLRLGFFDNQQEARSVLNSLKANYPRAWVVSVPAEEVSSSANSIYSDRRRREKTMPDQAQQAPVPPAFDIPADRPAGAADMEKVAALMKEAGQLMTDRLYDRAIQLYTKVLEYPESESSPAALEFLGLARERKGQLAQAKSVYGQYLEQYPEGEDAERVRQRLAGLVTASKTPKDRLKSAKSRSRTGADWDVFGGFSQFFRRDENTTEVNNANQTTLVTQKSLSSDLDITGRLRTADYDMRTRLTGGYLHDFLNNGDDSESTVSSLYFDARDSRRNLGLRLGRQSRSTGGVLGRFDGLLVDLPVTQSIGFSVVGGFPVNSSRDGFNNEKYFYGAGLEFEDFARGWDANAFLIEQQVESIIDRRAVGGELRYFDSSRSLFVLADYDIFYNALNTAQILGNWTTDDKTTFNIVLDYRNSPILTTSNALQGEPVLTTIEQLLTSFTEDQVYGFAEDRTASSKLATFGVTRPVSEKLQLSGDLTWSKLSDTVASGNVTIPNPGTDNEWFYNLQLIGSNLLKEGDITILGLRFIDATVSNTTSLSINSRYPVTKDFRVNPRFQVDYRQNQTDGSEQMIYRPTARLTYSIQRRFRLEAELGGEWSDREIVTGTTQSESYFVNLGYRADF